MEPPIPAQATTPNIESEQGVALLRTGEGSELLRRRIERSASLGRYVLVLLGVVAAAAGFALWVSTRASFGLAMGTFGGVLIFLGIVQHLLYRRDLAHWPDQAHLWTDGLELVLHNGEVRGASWADPDFSLHLVARRAPPPAEREYLLMWLMDSKVPPIELSATGFDQLQRMAADRGLQVSQTRRGSRANATQLIEIRQSTARTAAALASVTEVSGPE
jgi:hypothetical protein